MTAREMVAEQALSLSPEDRIYLLDQLERSLVPEETLSSLKDFDEPALGEELNRRSAAYLSGSTTMYDGFELMAELRRKRLEESL